MFSKSKGYGKYGFIFFDLERNEGKLYQMLNRGTNKEILLFKEYEGAHGRTLVYYGFL